MFLLVNNKWIIITWTQSITSKRIIVLLFCYHRNINSRFLYVKQFCSYKVNQLYPGLSFISPATFLSNMKNFLWIMQYDCILILSRLCRSFVFLRRLVLTIKLMLLRLLERYHNLLLIVGELNVTLTALSMVILIQHLVVTFFETMLAIAIAIALVCEVHWLWLESDSQLVVMEFKSPHVVPCQLRNCWSKLFGDYKIYKFLGLTHPTRRPFYLVLLRKTLWKF